MKKNIYISAAFAILFGMSVKAQQKDTNITTEEVRVVKAYEATVVDAFKIKENPEIGDEDNVKREVKYTIYSFPVASTFSPAKGQAAAVDKDSLVPVFNNYALLGYGNYNTLQANLGIAEKVSEDVYVAGFLNHRSSQGGIAGVLTDDNYSKSNLDFNVGSRKLTNDWNLNFGASQQNYNWYGLPTENFAFTSEELNGRNFEQKYNDLHLGFRYNTQQGFFDGGSVIFNHFWDAYESNENHLSIKPKFNFDLEQTKLNIDLNIDYLGTDFVDQTNIGGKKESNYFIFAAEPSIKFSDENYDVQLGVGVANISGSTNDEKDNAFVVYPKIKANVNLVKNIVIAYAGAEGGVTNNSYANFVAENPFVSPDLTIAPTKQQFNFYVGMKGKLYHNISYNVRVSYLSEDNKPMFVSNPIASNLLSSQTYQYGNSFGVTYDLVKTINAYGELNFNFTDDVTIDLVGEVNSYSASNNYVYNLPEAKISAKLNVKFSDQWFGGLNLYYLGKRNDLGYGNTEFEPLERKMVKVDSFADLNLNLGYKATDNWTIFAKGNNIFNQSVQMWSNYQVQGTQVLVGALYKFNFKN